MDWSKFCYFPVLKTKDAELRGISNLPSSVFSKMLPVYEITRSRISKNNPYGDISKRLAQIEKIQAGQPFILDVTTDTKQQNSQIESILNHKDGYFCWREFLEAHAGLNVCPAIHINLDDDPGLEDTKLFISKMSPKVKRMALRLPTGLDAADYGFVVDSVCGGLGDAKIYILIDDQCIRSTVKSNGIHTVADSYSEAYQILVDKVGAGKYVENFVCIAGSFPQSVKEETGKDEHGSFPIFEHELYTLLSNKHPKLRFGDYAAVNINQIEMRGGTFIPRIDFCTDDTFYFYRYRRNSGAYIKCAQKVLGDVHYQTQGTWGDSEILSAAKGSPSGISPSFWISVRINNYIVRRVGVLSL